MKKMLKIIGIILLILIVGGFIVLKLLGNRPVAPDNYNQTVPTGGSIETKYMALGNDEVSNIEYGVLQGFSKYTVYYPSELETSDKKYPVIVLTNGSGTPLSKYLSVPKHLASWGFIVIGTEEEYDWNGFSAEMCIRHLKYLNDNEKIEDKESLFYQKVDFDNVGIVGHSQGGVGVINAITEQKHKDIFKTAISLSPTNKQLAHNLEWDYDASLIEVPIMIISGAGGGDDWVLTGEQLQEIYSDIHSGKIAMRRVDTVHNEVLYSANGYVTAWFMWQLQGDEEAAEAFVGDNPEVLHNPMYQDQTRDLD